MTNIQFIDAMRANYRRSFLSAARQFRTLCGIPEPQEPEALQLEQQAEAPAEAPVKSKTTKR